MTTHRPISTTPVALSALARIGGLLGACVLAAGLPSGPAQAQGARSIALVLDASGSMNAQLADGTPRLDAAQDAVAELVATLSPDTRLAFRAYGHQSPREEKNCDDIELLAPFDSVANNKAAVVERARGLTAQGYTPITTSLTLAAGDLAAEEAASHVVVLVSDGKETCEGDPCVAAKALAEADAKLVVHTVGVGVDTVTRGQLQCIANNARGTYFDAASAAELATAMGAAAVQEASTRKVVVSGRELGGLKMEIAGHFTHEVVDEAGEVIAELSQIAETVELPAGIYGVTFGNGLWTGIEVKAGETTEIKPGFLEVDPIGGDLVYVLDPETGEQVEEIYFTKPRATLIPGRFDVQFGELLWPGGVELEPGETTTLRPGVLGVETDLSLFAFVLRTLDGQEAGEGDTVGSRSVTLPPGKYVLELDPDRWIETLSEESRTMEIDLAAGEELEITVE